MDKLFTSDIYWKYNKKWDVLNIYFTLSAFDRWYCHLQSDDISYSYGFY